MVVVAERSEVESKLEDREHDRRIQATTITCGVSSLPSTSTVQYCPCSFSAFTIKFALEILAENERYTSRTLFLQGDLMASRGVSDSQRVLSLYLVPKTAWYEDLATTCTL